MKININNGLINQTDTQPKSGFSGKSPVTASRGLGTSELTGKSAVTSPGALGNTDRTTLSSTTFPTVSSLVSEAMKTPSVRQDKVNALKDAVSSGSYVIDSTKIAGAISDEAGY